MLVRASSGEWRRAHLRPPARPSCETRCSPASTPSRRFFQRRPRPIDRCRPITARSSRRAIRRAPRSTYELSRRLASCRVIPRRLSRRGNGRRYSGVDRDRARASWSSRRRRKRSTTLHRRAAPKSGTYAASLFRDPRRLRQFSRIPGRAGDGIDEAGDHARSRCSGHDRQWAAPRNIRHFARRQGD